ncbi:MAG: UvrD-helicase domain-containing protein, partial [Propionibacteriaceae bacterium]|nr:UvrD-helicase domain-containing protein [Propionibacteriaceae bacterium]
MNQPISPAEVPVSASSNPSPPPAPDTSRNGRTAAPPFDVTAPLPGPGDCLCLEASAGTGKTWSIAALAVRYLIEAGYPVDQVMIITFSRASTAELRDRVRQRLTAAADQLRQASKRSLTGSEELASAPDPIVEAWLSATPEQLALYQSRADQACRDFDRAAIFTTHGFCDAMLMQLGVLVDHTPGDRLLADPGEVGQTVTADRYLAAFAQSGADFPVATAQHWTKAALLNPALPLVRPTDRPEPTDFTTAVRERVETVKRQLGRYTYDDMLLRLCQALLDPVTGTAAQDRLAASYPVVLVDEFQDTDPVQWQILRSAFRGRSALVLIGDPKQSIYGFRGADVTTYLAATADGDRATLDTNRRSAPELVSALESLLSQRPLGDDRIVATPVHSSSDTPRLLGLDQTTWAAPLRLRYHPATAPLSAAQARQLIDHDLIADIQALLAQAPRLDNQRSTARALNPSDIAVIVSTNRRGQDLLAKLTAAGLPAVFTGAQSVFASAAAADWLTWLQAIVEPRRSRLRAASLTGLIGWSLAELITADDDQLARLAAAMHQAGRLLDSAGPIAVLAYLTEQVGRPDRLARQADGGRRWTDIRHLAELLDQAQRRERLNPAA